MTDSQKDPRVEKLTDRYDSEAQAFEELWAPVLQGPARHVPGKLRAASAERVLDLGTGVGTFLPVLRERFPGAVLYGVDRSAGMLARVSDDTPCAVMDASSLAIASRCFDVVTLVFMLFHLPDPLGGLREVHRVLRPGGHVATLTWGDDFVSPATRVWDEELDVAGAGSLDSDGHLAQHEMMDTPDKVSSLLSTAGFCDVDVTAETCECTIDTDHLIGLRTSIGRNRKRFEDLDAASRSRFLAGVRKRLGELGPGDFVCRGVFVYGVARTPADA